VTSPYMPLYVADYIGDTQHLTTEQHGAYLLLLMAMWRNGGSLPNDASKLSRIARVSFRRWAQVSPEVMEFFTVEGDCIFSRTLARWRQTVRRRAVDAFTRHSVFDRDGCVCRYCGYDEGPFHLDHVIPWSRGGKDTADNLVVACAACNLSKGDKTPEEWLS